MALTSKKILKHANRPIAVSEMSTDEMLGREWLLNNSRGGFASGTVAGCNTRRYHGLLTGTLNPPANRVVALSNCLETIEMDGERAELSCFEFDGSITPEGYRYISEFRKDIGVHFDFDLGGVQLTKSIYLLPDTDAVAIVYDFTRVCREFEFSVRPFAAMRDFHSLQNCANDISAEWRDEELVLSSGQNDCGELSLHSDDMRFEWDSQWWYNFMYRKEDQRQQDCHEDLWSPGNFKCTVYSPCKLVLWGSLSPCGEIDGANGADLEIVLDSLMLGNREILEATVSTDEVLLSLYEAASQFVVERNIGGEPSSTILAGYPWFLDWGRDTFISLPGLLLSTGRFKQASSVLCTFAAAADKGMIPNRFDDYGGEAHYNSIDASMWFVHAAFEYLRVSKDFQTFSVSLLSTIRWIIGSYQTGTRFGIHADTDGLISGGDADTQLTWMDAKCGGIAFTPRYGKAVEINALWYSNLCRIAEFYDGKDDREAKIYKSMAEKVAGSFTELFWNEKKGYLNDCVLPDGTIDESLRPNQIYAVSLANSPLSMGQKRCVIGTVDRALRTPYGLRTLDPEDGRYIGRYEGSQMDRDRSYHQGTVWPHLLGPFIEAHLRANDFDRESKRKAMRYLRPLLSHLTDSGCVGNISEIFDGDEPQQPRGCFAQAWAVAEVLRAYTLINP
jgi:predicted glycogen debranching enzyme